MVTFATVWIYGSLMFALGWAIRHQLTKHNRSGPLRALGDEMLKGSNLYAVYDTKANDYTTAPIAAKHDAVAIRMFVDALTDERSVLHAHPADFELHLIGLFDNEGDIHAAKHTVLTGAAWLAAQQGTPKLEKEA